MTYFIVDDQLHLNPKVRGLLDPCLDGDADGLAALGIWVLAGSFAQAATSDGVVTRHDLIRLLLNPSLADHLASKLVEVKLWHTPGHQCPRCPAVAPGTWLFHDWFTFGGYDTAEQLKTKRLKRNELKDPGLLNAVWARDCTDPTKPGTAACRYCGNVVHRNSRRPPAKGSPDTRGTLDHVDPTKAVGPRNVVVACMPCNQTKGARTPAQADMHLQPPPRPDTDDPTRALAVSPPQRAAETPQDAAGGHNQALAVSPSSEAAETPQGDRITARITSDPGGVDQVIGAVPARVQAGRAGGAGSGQGPGLGESQGSGKGRRRRRRGRSRGARPVLATAGTGPEAGLDAGAAPAVPTAGRWGSPYHQWTGPPDRTGDETRCPAHPDQHLPCRRCATAQTSSEVGR